MAVERGAFLRVFSIAKTSATTIYWHRSPGLIWSKYNPLSEPMMATFYWRIYASLGLSELVWTRLWECVNHACGFTQHTCTLLITTCHEPSYKYIIDSYIETISIKCVPSTELNMGNHTPFVLFSTSVSDSLTIGGLLGCLIWSYMNKSRAIGSIFSIPMFYIKTL